MCEYCHYFIDNECSIDNVIPDDALCSVDMFMLELIKMKKEKENSNNE